MSEGFLITASREPQFYQAALHCADSIRDHYPEAKICVFTHSDWACEQLELLADTIVHPIPNHVRAKLWALPRSPYDRTVYVDAGVFCVHDDVQKIFEIEKDAPLLMTENRAYCSKVVYFTPTEEIHHRKGPELHKQGKCERLRWHWGLFRYDTEVTRQLIYDWLATLKRHHEGHTEPYAPSSMAFWDTYAFWRCFKEKDYGFEPQMFPSPDARWQYISGHYKEEELEGQEPVFEHYSIPMQLRTVSGNGSFAEWK